MEVIIKHKIHIKFYFININKTPIFYAVDCNNQELVHQLLEKGDTANDVCNDKIRIIIFKSNTTS